MKILHLEDNPADAALFREVFRREWPECDITVADDADTFSAGLRGDPDLILSDFSMPRYNGLEALKVARIERPDTPFVFLSGTIGEERAVEALRSGASDYIIKDRPQRLIPAIHRALKDSHATREKRMAEEQMLRIQRLENIGMLASGIAHDFNNVLSPILMAVTMLESRHTDPVDQKLCANIEQSARRGSSLVQQILSFVRGQAATLEPVDIAAIVQEIASLAERTFPPNVHVICDLETCPRAIRGNATQLHQVLLNLCVNARDAMPLGGVLTLRARHESLPSSSGVVDGDYVLVEVCDTGTGIRPDITEHVWEPFFTTKPEGQGSGLGLSTVRGIVKNHGGTITLRSALGEGTTFQLWLPVTGRS